MVFQSEIIGQSVSRIDGPDKVTGETLYAADVALPGMLTGKILRSPHPHARIRGIDTTAAWQIPGVKAIVTGEDARGCFQGKVLRDMPVLCWDRVRYIGDRVAAVAAETPEAADEALLMIEVDYEVLPAVYDPTDAMEPDAPLLHDDMSAYEGAPTQFLAPDLHNGQTRLYWEKGDLEQGFKDADVVLEHSFSIPSRHQGYIEPFASVIDIDDDGRIQAWCSSKAPFRARRQMAVALGLDEESIRVNVTSIGGDFGGKGDTRDLPIAYLLANMAGLPVKIVMSSVEEYTASNPTHPTFVTIKSGVKRDGQITAREVRTVHASGAYGALKPRAYLSTHHYVGGAYRIPNTVFEFLQVYTNTVPGGYFRAPGAHQYTFALECHTDLLARELHMDTAEFRRRNILLAGEEDGLGRPIDFLNITEVMDAALDSAGWDKPEARPGYGRGVALFGRQIGGGVAGAVLTAEADGSFSVISPTVDIGTGTHTIEKQIVASEMGVPINHVHVTVGDTDSVPYDEGPRASRVTYTEGQAVMKACSEIKQAIADGVTLPHTVTVEHTAEEREDITYFGAQVAEVYVDSETGQVEVLKLTTAHDVGTIINPMAHQGQIEGGVVTGFGLGVTEEFVTDAGQVVNGNMADYKLPTIADIPPLETVLIQTGGGTGPYEAKAIGELANNATAAAIANAVADAVDCRIFELPITADRVYEKLRSKRSA